MSFHTVEDLSTTLEFMIHQYDVISLILVVIVIRIFFSVGMKSPPSGNKLLGGSAKKSGYSEVRLSAVVPAEPSGNRLSISEFGKRRLDQEETRAPLSALNTYSQDEAEHDRADFTDGSPVKTSPKEGKVYTKRHKTGSTPETPPLRSPFRRRESKEASPPPRPVFESRSPDMRIETTTSSEASVPMVEQTEDIDTPQPLNTQLISPSITEDDR